MSQEPVGPFEFRSLAALDMHLMAGGRKFIPATPSCTTPTKGWYIKDGVLIRTTTTIVFSDAQGNIKDIQTTIAPIPDHIVKEFHIRRPKPLQWVCLRGKFVMTGEKPIKCHDCGGSGAKIVPNDRVCQGCGKPVGPKRSYCPDCKKTRDKKLYRERQSAKREANVGNLLNKPKVAS